MDESGSKHGSKVNDNYKRTNPTDMPEDMFTSGIILPDNIAYITGDDLGLAQEREIYPEQKKFCWNI